MVLYTVALKFTHIIGPVAKNMVIHEAEKCSVIYDVVAEWLAFDIDMFTLVCVHNIVTPENKKLEYFDLDPEMRLSDYIPAVGIPNVKIIVVPKPRDTGTSDVVPVQCLSTT
ncbi:hypothetical protein GGI13_008563, partial [Coemansia sp. RSA 455]